VVFSGPVPPLERVRASWRFLRFGGALWSLSRQTPAEDVARTGTFRQVQRARETAAGILHDGAGHGFNCNRRASYRRFAAQLARSRTIGLLRNAIGPRYDLGALWDRHADLEFKHRDADATMTTMVAEPYVNHVPTMTGGSVLSRRHRPRVTRLQSRKLHGHSFAMLEQGDLHRGGRKISG
jgi:hypothetical protein